MKTIETPAWRRYLGDKHMCDSKRDVRRNRTVVEFLKSLARDSGGAVAIYIAIVAPVMLGVGALSFNSINPSNDRLGTS